MLKIREQKSMTCMFPIEHLFQPVASISVNGTPHMVSIQDVASDEANVEADIGANRFWKSSMRWFLSLAIPGLNMRERVDSRLRQALTRGTHARMVVPSPVADDTSTSPPADWARVCMLAIP